MKIGLTVDKNPLKKQKYMRKRTNEKGQISLLLEPKKRDWWEDELVIVAYNVPRITARLEGLMGTNVVRLTDRTYMQQLRLNHEADCNAKLQIRIDRRKAAEKERQNYLVFRGHYTPENCPNFLKIAHSIAMNQEMERVRNLVVEGNMAKIPQELATHPVFIVNQKTNEIIAHRRAKLKTNREKNAERLIRQGAKWERERLIFEHLEKEKEEELKARQNEQSGLEEQYRQEDAVRGIELLRIHDKCWKPCELDLKKFLETEHARMKQRFIRKSIQYNSDPLDAQNQMRARKKFRETQEKICKRLEEQSKPSTKMSDIQDTSMKIRPVSNVCHETQMTERVVDGPTDKETPSFFHSDYGLQPGEDLNALQLDYQIDAIVRDKETFQKEMENDIKKELIIPKEVFDTMHYEDPLIAQLKKTENVQELYRVAQEVICPNVSQTVEEEITDVVSE